MKSKVEIRVFAIEQAVKIMGVGTPDKQVVEKAKEIESYIIGGAELPDVDTSTPIDKIIEAVSVFNGIVNTQAGTDGVG